MCIFFVHITTWSSQVHQHVHLLSQVQMGSPHLSLLPHNLLLFQESHQLLGQVQVSYTKYW